MPNYSLSTWQLSTSATAARGVFDWAVIDASDGFLRATARGRGARDVFSEETGGHRWQRVSPTEKRGRVHTSTITVAVLEASDVRVSTIRPEEVIETFYRGSGAGGQHRNKTSSAVRLQYRDLMVTCEQERHQHRNREVAWAELERRVRERDNELRNGAVAYARREQVGSGQRGDKRRTIAMQRDSVIDHVSGWRCSFDKYRRGLW